MKISSMIGFLVVISALFAIYGLMVHEANDTYSATIPNYVPLDSTNWSDSGSSGVAGGGKFDFVEKINGTIMPLQDKWKLIKDPDQGFFSKLVAGITAVPYAIMLVPDVLFASISMAGDVITTFLSVLNIPTWFTIAGLVMVLIWAVFKFLEYYQRVPV